MTAATNSRGLQVVTARVIDLAQWLLSGAPPGIEIEDASASDGLSEVTTDAADASATTVPTDAPSASDVILSTPPYGQGPVLDE
jgi:hypothetical protein